MSIVNSSSNVLKPPGNRQQQQAAGAMARGSAVGGKLNKDNVHFGQYRRNDVFVSTEPPEGKQGGLGEVTFSIPPAITKFGTPKEQEKPRDFRIIVPYIKPVREKNEEYKKGEHYFRPTNLTIPVEIKGEVENFKVLQKFEPVEASDSKNVGKSQAGYWKYALSSPRFDKVDKIHTYDAYAPGAVELTMPFNKAAAELIHHLNKNPDSEKAKEVKSKLAPKKEGEEELKTFDGNVDVVVGNDWLSGPVLYHPGVKGREDIRKIFYLHNTYDNALSAEEAGYDRGLPLPTDLTKAKDNYSPLTLAMRSADAVIANKNFVKTLTNTNFAKGQLFVDALKAHMQANTVFDMHHGLADDFTPKNNEFLRVEGAGDEGQKFKFAELEGDTPEDWAKFKQLNKAALQARYGLAQNPNAVVMAWAARLDPNQKGFYLVQNTIEKLLRQNKNLQIIIAGNLGDPKHFGPVEKKVEAWMKRVNEEFKGRLYLPNRFVKKDEITQMNAGSDFTILPSLYEPYGLTQLEALKMGSIPLVNGVDGLRSTVSDPDYNGTDFIGKADPDAEEAVWKRDRTGIIMKPIDVVNYRKTLQRLHYFAGLEQKVNEAPDKVYRPDKNPKAVFKQLREILAELLLEKVGQRERFTPEEKQKLTALKTRLEKDKPALKQSDIELLNKVLQKDGEHYTKPAENAFGEAVERALALATDPAKLSQVRQNGREFLEDKHNWETIVRERYNKVFDDNRAKPAENLSFTDKPSFYRTPPELIDEDAWQPHRPLTAKPQDDSSFVAKTWSRLKSTLMTMVYYLNVLNWFKKAPQKLEEE